MSLKNHPLLAYPVCLARIILTLMSCLCTRGVVRAAPAEAGELVLTADEKSELVFYAKCARMAYLGHGACSPLDGYRYLSQREWAQCGAEERDAGYAYDPTNGYLTVGSGLRGRLMVEKRDASHVIVSLSGCDIESSCKDFKAGMGMWWGNQIPPQFAEATNLVGWIRRGLAPHKLDVVGHSLGGALTTYVVAVLADEKMNVRGWTFNGLGLSNRLVARDLTPERIERVSELLTNVKGSLDPIFRVPRTVHYGKVQNIPYKWHDFGLSAHEIEELIIKLEAFQKK